MAAGSCKRATAELGHLIVGAHFTRTHAQGRRWRHTHLETNTVQKPTDINTCTEMTHIETEIIIFIIYFSIASSINWSVV